MSDNTSKAEPSVSMTRWMVDTRNFWPGRRIQDAAPEYLALISNEERLRILEKYNIADARMSLASALLKRAYIAKITGLPFSRIQISTRGDMFGKPCFVPPPELTPEKRWPYIDFNVSHQAGLTVLVGIAVHDRTSIYEKDGQVYVGCDIVAPRERLDVDLAGIRELGFEEFISAFAEMFSPAELSDIIHHVPLTPLAINQRSDPRVILEAKLRRFYTYFCIKEAYIKLVGEGLLAEWIKECDFRNVRVPRPLENTPWGEKISAGLPTEKRSEEGENDELQIWLHGKEIKDVQTEMQAFEPNFVITTMMKSSNLLGSVGEFPPWEALDLERDVLLAAKGC